MEWASQKRRSEKRRELSGVAIHLTDEDGCKSRSPEGALGLTCLRNSREVSVTQDICQIDPESLDPRGTVGAHLWNTDGVLGRSWGLRAEMGCDLLSGWSRSLRRPPGQGVAMEDKREGGPSAPRGRAQQPRLSLTSSPAPSGDGRIHHKSK